MPQLLLECAVRAAPIADDGGGAVTGAAESRHLPVSCAGLVAGAPALSAGGRGLRRGCTGARTRPVRVFGILAGDYAGDAADGLSGECFGDGDAGKLPAVAHPADFALAGDVRGWDLGGGVSGVRGGHGRSEGRTAGGGQMQSSDLPAIMTAREEVAVKQDFTDNRDRLLQALDQLMADSGPESSAAADADPQLSGLRTALDAGKEGGGVFRGAGGPEC